MSVKEIKAMGERLAGHLALKHGVKLKHMAILEAMAIQFGFKDWNTFRAVLEDEEEKGESGPVAGKPEFQFGERSYLMGYNGDVPCELGYEDMRRNLLICGATGSGLSMLHQNLWSQHIRKGGGVIFLDTGHDLYMKENLSAAFRMAERSHELLVLDFDRQDNARRFNPLTGAPAEIARTIMSGRFGESEEFDAWRDFSEHAVKALVAGLQEASRPVSFRTLLQLVDDGKARAELIALQPVTGQAISGLRDLHARFEARDKTTASIMVLVRSALLPFTEGELGRIFDSTGPAVNLRDVLEKRHSLYINLPAYHKGPKFLALAKLVIRQILLATQTAVGRDSSRGASRNEEPPFLIFLDDPGAYWTGDMAALLAQARSLNIGCVLTQQTGFRASRWAKPLLAQTWCKVFLRQPTLEGAKLASEVVGEEYRATDAGLEDIRPRVPADEFLHLLTGEGVCVRGPHSTRFRVPIRDNPVLG